MKLLLLIPLLVAASLAHAYEDDVYSDYYHGVTPQGARCLIELGAMDPDEAEGGYTLEWQVEGTTVPRGFRYMISTPGDTTSNERYLLLKGGGYAPELVGSSRVDLQACKLEYSIVSPK